MFILNNLRVVFSLNERYNNFVTPDIIVCYIKIRENLVDLKFDFNSRIS